ncbi:tautomerase-like protein [Kribbella sp. VKM Ac-2571]|uniref:tautomerase family protein n=1 Tax=Kribbella sp. VKM Ac-2571 TaxID=2512222 RepID=UPI00105ED00C|nr:tautomerase family protein [Kribbella sp. VKM Ac-2571]TDO67644.1 tautomerase-like protein [Kribbella sp. VKM Ac-2571]
MPLVRIDLSADRPAAQRRAIADGVHHALVEAIGIPADDRFQIVTPHAAGELIFDPSYLGVDRRDVVYIQITLVQGRSRELKLELYRRITERLTQAGVRAEDVTITLVETALDGWSVGNGKAQLVELGTVPGADLVAESVAPDDPGAPEPSGL